MWVLGAETPFPVNPLFPVTEVAIRAKKERQWVDLGGGYFFLTGPGQGDKGVGGEKDWDANVECSLRLACCELVC